MLQTRVLARIRWQTCPTDSVKPSAPQDESREAGELRRNSWLSLFRLRHLNQRMSCLRSLVHHASSILGVRDECRRFARPEFVHLEQRLRITLDDLDLRSHQQLR